MKVTPVAPHVGAWIETPRVKSTKNTSIKSHPMWVRGLKLAFKRIGVEASPVAPHVGAWIETFFTITFFLVYRSHPMWVRGLKLLGSIICKIIIRRTPCGCVD